MKNKILLYTLAVIFASPAVFAVLAGERTFNVNKGGTLQVSLSSGDVHISTWDRNEVKISYDEGDEFQMEQSGNTINIEDESFGGENLDISIPTQFNVDVETQSGDVKIKGSLKGNVEVVTSGGDLEIGEVVGTVDLRTAGGNITTGNIKGDVELNTAGGDVILGSIDGKVGLKTAGGNVTVKEVTESIFVATGGGNVSLRNVAGKVDISSGGGNIIVTKAGEEISITTGGGNISIGGGKGKTILTTGGGNIDIKNLAGSIKAASGGGNITVEMDEVIGKSSLSTGMGDVRLSIPENAKATIVVNIGGAWETNWNELLENVISDFKLKSSKKDEENDVLILTYEVNGGGSIIRIDSGEGTVHLKKK